MSTHEPDWLTYDPYVPTPRLKIGDGPWIPIESATLTYDEPERDTWPGFYDWATAVAPSRPIMLGEWGFDLSTEGGRLLRRIFRGLDVALTPQERRGLALLARHRRRRHR